MRLLNGNEYKDEALVVREHFLYGVKPSNFTETLAGTATISYSGANLGNGVVNLAAPALNDSALLYMNLPFRIDKWNRIELAFYNTLINCNDDTKIAFSVAVRDVGAGNYVAFGLGSTTSLITRTKRDGAETINYFTVTPTKRHDYKIVATANTVDFYCDGSMVFRHTTNIPYDKDLKPALFVKNNETGGGTSKILTCDRVELALFI